jgi:hypothetical protein
MFGEIRGLILTLSLGTSLFAGSAVFAQNTSVDGAETTRRNRERFEPRVDSAIAAARAAFFSLRASTIELEPIDQKMDAATLAKALFSEELMDFRAQPKVRIFLDEMIKDLEIFLGRTPDQSRIEMLEILHKALIDQLLETQNGSTYKASEKTQFYRAIGFGVVSVGAVHISTLLIYLAWKNIFTRFPQNLALIKNWSDRKIQISLWRLRLFRAHRSKNFARAEECSKALAAFKKPRGERVKRNRKETLRNLGRLAFWLVVDSAAAGGVAWGMHFWQYQDLKAWQLQENFVENTFDEFALEKKRLAPLRDRLPSSSDRTNPSRNDSP